VLHGVLANNGDDEIEHKHKAQEVVEQQVD